jgi:hypothetical protein
VTSLNKDVLLYKGYYTRVQYDCESKVLYGVLEGINDQTVTDEQVIQRVQAVVDKYDNGVMMGEFDLKRSSDASNWKTIKTFTLTVNPKYIPE